MEFRDQTQFGRRRWVLQIPRDAGDSVADHSLVPEKRVPRPRWFFS